VNAELKGVIKDDEQPINNYYQVRAVLEYYLQKYKEQKIVSKFTWWVLLFVLIRSFLIGLIRVI
jgi:hypothetical protein